MAQSLRFDTTEVEAYADILTQAPGAALADVRRVIAKGALNIKDDARRRVSGIAHARNYPRTITYDSHQTPTGGWAEIGPEKDKHVGGGPHQTPGNLGHFFEFGGLRNAPIPHMRPAAEAELPRFEKAMRDLAEKALGR